MNRQDKPPQRPNTRPAETRPANPRPVNARPTDTRSSRSPSSNASSSGERRRRRPPPSSSLSFYSVFISIIACVLAGGVVVVAYEWYRNNKYADAVNLPAEVASNQRAVTVRSPEEAAIVAKYTYIEPTAEPKARLRVSGGYFTGTPNLICTLGAGGYSHKWGERMKEAGPDVKMDMQVKTFGVLLGSKHFPGYLGRRVGIPVSKLDTQKPQAEVYIPAGKPFTLGFLADGEPGTVCGSAVTFTPEANKDYEAIGELFDVEALDATGKPRLAKQCKMDVYEISVNSSKPVNLEGRCMTPSSLRSIL